MKNILTRFNQPATLASPTVVPSDQVTEGVAASRSIARMAGSMALTPAQLEEREIIHRSARARVDIDVFRELRTRLLAVSDENFITLVAPVSRGSGGSFVTRNLAAAFALDQAKSALLVDCDLLHPCQHTTMRIDVSAGGLIDYLEDPGLSIADVLYDTGMPRLRLIPTGASREISGEYFTSFRMRLLLDSLRSRYKDRYIFLDSPPVEGAPEARLLSDLADVVVLVAGYGRDTPAAIAQAAANFEPRKFAGVVFNEGI